MEAFLSLHDPQLQVGVDDTEGQNITILQLILGSLWRQNIFVGSHLFQGGVVTEGLLRRAVDRHCAIYEEQLMIGDRLVDVTSKNAFHHNCFCQWVMDKTPEFFSFKQLHIIPFRSLFIEFIDNIVWF